MKVASLCSPKRFGGLPASPGTGLGWPMPATTHCSCLCLARDRGCKQCTQRSSRQLQNQQLREGWAAVANRWGATWP
eukprot:4340980-Alexandrium_andersonii.AAC.1